ncbi:DUF4145 domain-containing protein [Fictibacillus nanhaiensis]|uniref:DUF4145 domain-containing protein n=1 Tax=Fictibacillus nanhaiensis TaxID=742169 RepID=UPI003C14D94B
MTLLEEKVYCKSCKGIRNHFIIYQYPVHQDNEDLEIILNHSVLKCAGCDEITYADVYNIAPFDEYSIGHIQIYPDPPAVSKAIHSKFLPFETTMPLNIQEIFEQLISSYNQKHNLLCAIGLRTLIEAICNELRITKGFKYDNTGKPLTQEGKKESIEGKIYGLFEHKHIVWYEALILQRIREIGNAAAHELVTPTSEELHSAIAIVEKLIDNIYHLKEHKLLKK